MRQNWKSGLAVALVSMPLSISLAVASGSTPTIGIITAIWAGLVASVIGGSNFSIIGPTGALSGLIISYVITNGMADLPIITIITGFFILAGWALKVEKYLIFIPSSVIHGFTLGVAFIIGFNQMDSALGLYGLPSHGSLFLNIVESFRHIGQSSVTAFFVFLCSLCLLFLLRKYIAKIPGAIILAVLGIGMGYLQHVDLLRLNLATLGSVFSNISFSFYKPWQPNISMEIVWTALAIALIAILETMLSAKVADTTTGTKHNQRKEMFGLAAANLASGIMGGLPATAALARTSFNIKNGATDKLSATLNSVFLLIISFFFLSYFAYIPMPVIAAILVYVAINMVETRHFVRFFKYQPSGFWLSLLVAVITFYKDPIIGILLGTVISLLLFVEKISHGQFDIKLNTFQKGLIKTVSGDQLEGLDENADVLLYSIEGKLSYINNQAHITRFERSLSNYKVIVLRFRGVYFVDLDGAEAVEEIIGLAEKRGQKIYITSINEKISAFLEAVSPRFKQLKARGHIFTKSEEALSQLGIHISH